MLHVMNAMRQALIWGCAYVCWLGCPAVRAAYVPGTTNLVYADGATGASYLLYLPTVYDSNSPPPLMLYFDPGANSGYGMQKLQPSCEAAGWVLACANGLGNTAIANEDIVTREIMDDVRQRIPHDRRRFYLAGLSGGAWRANSVAREYWNEAAGLLLMGCWIGDYDDYTVFPDRLAVARVNGLDDICAIASEPEDLVYYTQTMVRVHDVHFAGGHEIGPTNAISEALDWLDEDFTNVGESYIPGNFDAEASSLVANAQTAWNASNYNLVVSNVVATMHRYPMSSSIREAEQLLFLVFTNETLRSGVHFDPEPSEAWSISWMLMQRGLGTDAYFPVYFAQAYFEAAIQACPTNARALAECAHQILNDAARNRREWPRAAELAESAFQLKTNHWRAPYVQYELAERMGDMRGALSWLQESTDRMPGYLGNDALSLKYLECEDSEARYAGYVAQIQSIPLPEDFELLPMKWNVAGKRGWMVPWGQANNQTQVVHNGLCAMSITGRESLAFLNCSERTNEVAWIDFYAQPHLGGSDSTNLLPPQATTVFYVQSNGLIRVYDGTASNWTTLANAPIPGGQWSRISIRADCLDQEWSIRLNDVEVGSGLGFAHSNAVFSGMYFLHDGDSPTVLDDLTISTNEPLADADRDGLPDAWEELYGLNLADPSDSGLDPDRDLYANYEEYRLGTSPKEWNAPPVPSDFATVMTFFDPDLPINTLLPTNHLHRHHRLEGDVPLVATNDLSIYFTTSSDGANPHDTWISSGTTAGSLPLGGVVEKLTSGYFSSDQAVYIQGPFNALYHVILDESTGEFSLEWGGFHDADGDTMMDELETFYTGSPTALTPYGNPDGDAYPNLVEYLRNTSPLSHDPYSGYSTVSLATSFNGWSTTQNYMTPVGDHVWRYYLGNNNGTYEFKFVANSSWAVNWGDNHQATTNVSFRDVADVGGANIILNLTNSAYLTLVFNDLTRRYAFVSEVHDADRDGIPDAWEAARYTNIWWYGTSSDPDGDGWVNVAEYLEDTDPFVKNTGMSTNASVCVVGSFSGWNTALNPMEPAGNHLWKLDLAFTNLAGAEFKFVANGSWSTAWGASNSASFALPLQGMGNPQGGSPNFKPAAPLDGVYRFTFNEACALCTLDYAPGYILHQTPEWTVISTNRALVLKWLSSSDRYYSLYRYTNLLTEPELLGAYIPATPPLNVITQAIDPELRLGIFQIRLEE